jgi:hypothetical protein
VTISIATRSRRTARRSPPRRFARGQDRPFSKLDGCIVTLPAATGTATRTHVVIGAAVNANIIKVANGTDVMAGSIAIQRDVDGWHEQNLAGRSDGRHDHDGWRGHDWRHQGQLHPLLRTICPASGPAKSSSRLGLGK